ncbi:ABC transporter permease [Paenibacillus tarimensis]
MLKKEIFKAGFITLLISALISLLYAADGTLYSIHSSSEVVRLIFGSVTHTPLNWVYWIILCVAYLIMLQFIWKSNLHLFEILQILRFRNISRYWISKFLYGLLFTIFYVLTFILATYIMCYLFGVSIDMDSYVTWIFLCLSLNLYIHALLWLAIKLFFSVEAAHIMTVALFYAGVRIVQPYAPLYYSMYEHISPQVMVVFLLEAAAIAILVTLILWRAKKIDYF